MKMKRLIFTLMLSTANFFLLCAQDRLPHDGVASPSNTESSYSSDIVSTDLYTGTAKVNLKLYSYQNSSCDLSNSIVISYDASGVKADAIASDVGLNWRLDVGGAITRTIIGNPDDLQNPPYSPKGFLNLPDIPIAADLNLGILDSYTGGGNDGEFDIYNYTAGEYSGSFIIGKNGDILQIPKSNVRIQRIPNPGPLVSGTCNNSSFIITIPNGVKYKYTQSDCQEFNGYYLGFSANTWVLNEIESKDGQSEIVFHYFIENLEYETPAASGYTPLSNVNIAYCDLYQNRAWQKKNYTYIKPDYIMYPNGNRIDLIYDQNAARRDLVDFVPSNSNLKRALKEIRITENYPSPNGNYYGYKLEHKYMLSMGGNSLSNFIPYNGPFGLTDDYVLLLDKMYKYSGTINEEPYEFTYDPQSAASDLLGRMDLWGYYNTGIGNTSSYTPYEKNGISLVGNSRLPSLPYTKSRSLQKIVTPSGGEISFEFELHDSKSNIDNDKNLTTASQVGGLRLKKLFFKDGIDIANTMTKEYKYVENDGVTSSGVMANFPINAYEYSEYNDWNTTYAGNISPVAVCTSSQPINAQNASTNFVFRKFNTLNSLVLTHGKPVGYGRVEEYLGTSLNFTKKIVHTYTTSDDHPIPPSLNINTLPFPYIPSNDFLKGLKLSEKSYTPSGLLQNEVNYEYQTSTQIVTYPQFRGIKAAINHWPPLSMTDYNYSYVYPITGYALLTKILSKKYFNNGAAVENEVTKTYDINNLVLKSELTQNSKNEIITKNYYYPFEYTIAGAIAQLNTDGTKFFPIVTEVWKGTGPSAKLLSSNANIYQQGLWGVKQDKAYKYTAASPITQASWGSFNANSILQNPSLYTEVAKFDQYDTKGNLTQMESFGETISFKWGYLGNYKILKARNTQIEDIAYTSFEGDVGNDFTIQGTTSNPTTIHSITGHYSYHLNSGTSILKNGLNPQKTYILSVWTRNGMPTLMSNGVPVTLSPSESHNGWTLYKGNINNSTNFTLSSVQANYIDELRVYPTGSAVETYTYQPLFSAVTSVCDAGNKIIYYEYDCFGKLKLVRDIDGNILQKKEYVQQEQY